jgi:hypothetical protein
MAIATPAMAHFDFNATCPSNTVPVLAAGYEYRQFSMCCPPDHASQAILIREGPRCCAQPEQGVQDTCTETPASADDCAGGYHKHMWELHHIKICREADAIPPAAKRTEVNAKDDAFVKPTKENQDTSAAKRDVDFDSPLERRASTAYCPFGSFPSPLLDPGLLMDPPKWACCPNGAIYGAVKSAFGLFCCTTTSCDQSAPAVSPFKCLDGNNPVIQVPGPTLVCKGKKKRGLTEPSDMMEARGHPKHHDPETYDEPKNESDLESWCSTHNDPHICLVRRVDSVNSDEPDHFNDTHPDLGQWCAAHSDLRYCNPDGTPKDHNETQPDMQSWCSVHADPRYCNPDGRTKQPDQSTHTLSNRDSCSTAPENGNCRNTGTHSRPSSLLIWTASFIVILFSTTSSAAALPPAV